MIKKIFIILFLSFFSSCYFSDNTSRVRYLNTQTRLYNYPYVIYGPQPSYYYVYPRQKPVIVQPPRNYYYGPRKR